MTKAELMAYSWKASVDGSLNLYINENEILYYKDDKKPRPVKWISDTSLTTLNHHFGSRNQTATAKIDTVVFYSECDWISPTIISKITYKNESVDGFYASKYKRHENR